MNDLSGKVANPVDRGVAGPGRQHRLLHREVRAHQLHALRGDGVRALRHPVNGLTPTATMPDDPELAAQFTKAADAAVAAGKMDFRGLNPSPRLPTPTDCIAPAVFLASDDSAMMTGTNLTVDGGALAKYWPQLPH